MGKQKDDRERHSGMRRGLKDSGGLSGKSQMTSRQERNRARKDREQSKKLQLTSGVKAGKEGSSGLQSTTFQSKSKELGRSSRSIESRNLKDARASPYQRELFCHNIQCQFLYFAIQDEFCDWHYDKYIVICLLCNVL